MGNFINQRAKSTCEVKMKMMMKESINSKHYREQSCRGRERGDSKHTHLDIPSGNKPKENK